MAAEAIVKVNRTVSEAARTIEELNQSTREALANLERLNPAVGQAMRAWEALHTQYQTSGQFTEQQRERYAALTTILQRQVEQARQLPPESHGRPLTEPERTAAVGRGYAEERLEHARMVRFGSGREHMVIAKPSPLPEWVRETNRTNAELADRLGVSEQIVSLSKQGQLTAKQIAQEIGHPDVDAAIVRSVRDRAGLAPISENVGLWGASGPSEAAPATSPRSPDAQPPVSELEQEGTAHRVPSQSPPLGPGASGSIPREPPPMAAQTRPFTAPQRPFAHLPEQDLQQRLAEVEQRRLRAERDVERATEKLAEKASPERRAEVRAGIAAGDPEYQRTAHELEQLRTEVEHRQAPSAVPPHRATLLTEDEKERFRGRYTEDELSRARLLRSGTLLIHPPASRARIAEDAPVARSVPEASQASTAPADARRRRESQVEPGETTSPAAVGPNEAERRREDEAQDAAIDRHADRYRRLGDEKRTEVRTSRDLQDAWRRLTQDLKQQEMELDRTATQFVRLRTYQKEGIPLTARERVRMGEYEKRLPDLREGLRGLREEREQLRAEAPAAGLREEGGRLVPAGGGWRKGASAFAAGAGFGGGGVSGPIFEAMLGYVSPTTAALAVGGYAMGRAWGAARSAHERRIAALGTTIPLSIASGVMSPDAFTRLAAREARTLKRDPGEILVALRMLAQQTGRLDMLPYVDAAAVATGQPPEGLARQMAPLFAREGRSNPPLMYEMIGAFGRSTFHERSARAPLGITTTLLPSFIESAARIPQEHALFPTSNAGAAEELAESSRYPVPGIETGGPASMTAAEAYTRGLNQFTSRPPGLFKDIAMMAVQRLSRTNPEAAERLKQDFGIDIGTLPGVWRAIHHAPDLAQQRDARGRPYDEIFTAIQEANKQVFRSPVDYETALDVSGVDPDQAYLMANRPVQRMPRRPPPIDVEAGVRHVVDATPEVEAVYQSEHRSQVADLLNADRTGVQTKVDAIGNQIHQDVVEGMNNLTRLVVDLLTEQVNHPPAAGSTP